MTFALLPRLSITALLVSATLALSGCKSAEEKAEDYYQSGLSLMEAGDPDRAMIEFRNVFDYDGFHKEARRTYADLLLQSGDTAQAVSQYLRLIEQYPDTLDVRLILAEQAVANSNWAEAERHGEAAIALDEDNLRGQAIALALAYRDAVVAGNQSDRRAVALQARDLLDVMRADDTQTQDNTALVRIVLDDLIAAEDTAGALKAVDAALEYNPDAYDLNMMKVQLLDQAGENERIGDQLKMMSTKFPEKPDVQQNLIRWYVNQNDTAGAIAYLRTQAGPLTGDTAQHMNIVEFLTAAEGPDAARAELIKLRDANAGTEKERIYASSLSTIDFNAGQTEAGIAGMRTALDGAESTDQTRRMQVTLAQMLDTTNARDEAVTLVETVLQEDPSNVEALKLQAQWLISQDKASEAIVALRTALDQNPQDSETLILMAQAHRRDGDIALAGERLALAVQVADRAPEESLYYADFLIAEGSSDVAVTVLNDANRQTPGNTDILKALANLYLQKQDWSSAQRTVESLRRIDTPEAREAVPLIQASVMRGQNRTSESLSILESTIDPEATISGQSTSAVALIVQTQIRSGKPEEARAYLDKLMAAQPDNADLKMLDASLLALSGDLAAAEDRYRTLIAEFPTSDVPVQYLANLLVETGRDDVAAPLVDEALTRVDETETLRVIKAGLLEKAGQIDDAIAVYESMYADNSDNIVIANNLASMIASHRDDPDSLARAATIARRLRGSDVPAFQDTYGWIAHRRGNSGEALDYLVPAATSLPTDPLVQLHLGMAYAGAGQVDKARETLTRALEMSNGSTLPAFESARETLTSLETGTSTQP